MTSSKDKVIKRILALMEKSTGAGCTEAEALAAAEKVQQLLHKYQLSIDECKLKEESTCRTGKGESGQKTRWGIDYAVTAIGYFTDTRAWQTTDAWGHMLYQFFGLESDVTVAEYVYVLLSRAIIDAAEDFKDSEYYLSLPKKRRGRVRCDFEFAMGSRLSERLHEMKDAQKNDVMSDGKSLVVVKDQIVTEEFAKLGLNLTRGTGQRRIDPTAGAAGQNAGDRVNINPGVHGQANVGQLS